MKKIFLLLSLLALPFVFQQCCRENVQNYALDRFDLYLVQDSLFEELAEQDSVAFEKHAFRVVPGMRFANAHTGGTELLALTCYQYYRSLSGIQSIRLEAEDALFSGIQSGDTVQHLAEFRPMDAVYTPDSGWISATALMHRINEQMREGATKGSHHGVPRLDFVFRFKQRTLPGRHRVKLITGLSDGRISTGLSEAFLIQ